MSTATTASSTGPKSAKFVVIRGLNPQTLGQAILRARERGELDNGSMLIGLEQGQAAKQIEIPWSSLIPLWEQPDQPHSLHGEFRIDDTTVSGTLRGGLNPGVISIHYS